jgi:DNA-binding IscR family transcriptional regulator
VSTTRSRQWSHSPAPTPAPLPTNALAERLDLSYNYLLTNVAVLRRAGFVKMRRAAGGLQLAKPAHTITLSEIICAIDGPLTLADGSQPTNPADQGLEQPAAVTVRG